MGAVEQSASCFRSALDNNPLSFKAHYGLGLIYSAAGQEDEATRCFSMALKLNPDFAPARARLEQPAARTQVHRRGAS